MLPTTSSVVTLILVGGSMYSNERRLSVNDNSAQWGDS